VGKQATTGCANSNPDHGLSQSPPRQYLTRYRQILERLDPGAIREQLFGYGDVPVMLCWEAAHDCHTGGKWCHRHLAAQWLEESLGIDVPEVGISNLDRFAYLRKLNIAAPTFSTSTPPANRKLRLR